MIAYISLQRFYWRAIMCLCFYNISPSSPTWYFHPAQQVRGFREKCKWDLNGLHRCYIIVSPSPPNGLKKQMDWLTCGPVGRSLRRRWIYIQRPAFFFNLSSSSPSAAGTACSSLRRPAALFCAPQRNATPPTARPSLHSAPPVILCRV